jgi:PAS domain-containing protein/DNA-binding CsgD family transcriptional regulator
MSIDERTLTVIQAFYDAAMDEARWPEALKVLTDFTGSQAATFWVLDGSPAPRLPTLTILNFDNKFMEEYLDHMVPLDPTVCYLVRHPDVPIVHDGLVMTERSKDGHAYYDWHGRWSDTRFRMVGQARPAASVQTGVALHRTRKVGRYEACDIERFAFLHRHLEQAIAIGYRLGTLGTMQRCTAELLDRNPAAILLLDENKRIVFANRIAQALEADGDGVKLSAGGVTLPRKQDNERLQVLIARALTTSSAGYALRALRPSDKRPYGIIVGPVSKQYSMLSAVRPAVCVVITDPARATPVLKDRLQAVFGLTEAEARLASLLADGEKLRAAAENLGITYGTCRTRLAEIFKKRRPAVRASWSLFC